MKRYGVGGEYEKIYCGEMYYQKMHCQKIYYHEI